MMMIFLNRIMKKTVTLISIIFAAILAGCSKEPIQINEGVQSKSVTIKVGIVDVKTTLQDDLSVFWSESDQIAIKDSDGTMCVFTLSSGAGSSTGEFTCDECTLKTSGNYEAYYPVSIAGGNLPYQPVFDGKDISYAPMYGSASGTLSTLNIAFHNIASILKVNVSTDLSNTALKKIILTSEKGMSGKFSIVDNVAVVDPASVNPLEMICKSAQNIGSTPSTFIFPVPAGTYNNLVVTLVGSNGGTQTLTAKQALTFQCGKVNTINLKANSLILDLGFKAGTSANCYIVDRKGHCRINPVKGNSTQSVGTVRGAKVLWTTLNTSTAPAEGKVVSNARVEGGCVLFECDGTEGNALIAAYSDEACTEGNVLWSWHIWRINTLPEDQLYASGATFMGLNLGAKQATKSGTAAGFVYQWGRKDPFPLSYGTAVVKTLPDRGDYAIGQTAEIGTSEWAQAHPDKFITTSTQDWLVTSDNDRWSTNKTINDPCPAGYKVPSLSSWPNTFTYNFITGTSTNGAYYFDSLITGETQCWYPAGGNLGIGDGKLASANTRSMYWAQETPGDTGKNGSVLRVQSGSTNKTAANKGYGMSVRCIRIQSILPPADQEIAFVEGNNAHIAAARDGVEAWTMDVSQIGKGFVNLSEIKPVDNLSSVLVTCTGGGVAKIRISDNEVLFSVKTTGEPHSIEQLPDGKFVVACAMLDNDDNPGGWLRVFDASGTKVSELVCNSAHNAVWDNARNVLWATSDTHLNSYSYDSSTSKLTLSQSYPLPARNPHDLFPVHSGGSKLWLTTDTYIYTFDAVSHTFEFVRAFYNAKSISSGTDKYTTIVSNWTKDLIDLDDGKTVRFTSPGDEIYKARWMLNNAFSYGHD